MVWTGRFELPASGSRSRRSTKLSHVQMSAESGSRTRTPLRGTGLSTRRVYRSTISAYGVARATRASPGCRPPPPPVRAAGTRRRRRRVNPLPSNLVRKARLALARPGGHQLLRLACLRSITSACGRRVGREPPRGVDPRTRRYKGRGPAGAGGVVPTGGLAPPRLAAPGFGSGVSAFHHVGERAAGRGRVVPASGARTPYRVRTGDLLLEGEACWPTPPTGLGVGPAPRGDGPARPVWSLSDSNRPPPHCK